MQLVQRTRDMRTLGIILVATLLFLYAGSRLLRRYEGPGAHLTDETYTTAKLLHAANATIYGARSCGYTVRQMERFHNHVHLIDYVECGEGSNPRCRSIKGFPTWTIGNKTLMGDQPLHVLRAAAEHVLRGGSSGPAQKDGQQEPGEPSVPTQQPSQEALMAAGEVSDLHPTM